TPAHQYPMGVTLHPDRRRQLISWARETGALVIEDDYDGEFRYDRRPVGALQEMGPDCVAYLGTTSKTLGPELRLGWMVLPPARVDAAIEAKLHADHHTDALAQLALANLLSTYAYDRHVRTRRLRYRGRRDLLQTVLGESTKFGAAGFRLEGIAAGLHALLTLPLGGEGEAEVRTRAEAAGLGVGYLGEHWHRPGTHPQGVIVGFGASSDAAYPAAVKALVAVLTNA
ncbi:MAG TPA: aminotransferase class I/II-fold pyridoxal phosphate-dependent enzyme, partial [Chloroflexota bacterium]|nr:aminotransferase class I/II-fold pyridoxal phosphate-dependent enzyme [Chloroflexota bacterium]